MLLPFMMAGCLTGGTHESIKYYEYNVPKPILEKVVKQIIAGSGTIKQDTAYDYYNNDTTYVSVSIKYDDVDNNYIFQYGGDKEYWDTSKTSSISIAYAYNKDGEGGSEGNGGVKWYNYKLKRQLTEPLEKELIVKIDSALGIKHVEGD